MSDRDLRAELLAWIEAREKECQAATPGPWFAWLSESAGWTVQIPTGWLLKAEVKMDREGHDAHLIASARTALPLALKALREEVEEHVGRAGFCEVCRVDDYGGGSERMPCPPLRRLHAAILGESA